jgi:hypothetical protein
VPERFSLIIRALLTQVRPEREAEREREGGAALWQLVAERERGREGLRCGSW